MDETVHRLPRSMQLREAPMLLCQDISKLFEHTFQIERIVWMLHTMVQMNLDLPQSFVLEFGQPLQKKVVVLLSWEEIGVTKWSAVSVVNCIAYSMGLPAPIVQA
jgi:hypothetical protein